MSVPVAAKEKENRAIQRNISQARGGAGDGRVLIKSSS
jgi:hypothetical protein